MRDCAIAVGVFLLVLIICTGITWAIQGSDFILYRFWAPKYASVQRDVFEQTPSYVRGNEQEVLSRKLEYDKAKAEGKTAVADAIASDIIYYAHGLNTDHWKQSTKDFIKELEDENAKPEKPSNSEKSKSIDWGK